MPLANCYKSKQCSNSWCIHLRTSCDLHVAAHVPAVAHHASDQLSLHSNSVPVYTIQWQYTFHSFVHSFFLWSFFLWHFLYHTNPSIPILTCCSSVFLLLGQWHKDCSIVAKDATLDMKTFKKMLQCVLRLLSRVLASLEWVSCAILVLSKGGEGKMVSLSWHWCSYP